MTQKAIRPSSLEGIKRLAKQIKKSRNVSHSVALNEAAREGAFANFSHARRVLLEKVRASGSSHELYLTYYWLDRQTYQAARHCGSSYPAHSPK